MTQKIISRLGKDDIMVEAQALQVLMHRYVPLQTRLDAAAFDGDSFPTTAKTLIDLSAVYGVPAGIRAIDAHVQCRDSGSLANACVVRFGPTNVAGAGRDSSPRGLPDDESSRSDLIIPCDANGDIYYQIVASGGAVATFDLWLQIWGYFI